MLEICIQRSWDIPYWLLTSLAPDFFQVLWRSEKLTHQNWWASFFKALKLAHLRISSFSTFIWSESREFVDSLSLRSSFKCESCNLPLSMSVLRSSICWIRSLDSCWFWWLEAILEDNGDSLRSSSIVLLFVGLCSSRLRSIFYCANNKWTKGNKLLQVVYS